MSSRRDQGVTLIEVMIVLGITAIIAGLAAPSFADFLNRQRVKAIAAEVSTDLAYARAEAGLRPVDVIVEFKRKSSVSCYTIYYQSDSGSCDCSRPAGTACQGGPVPELKTAQMADSLGVTFEPAGTWPSRRSAGQLQFKAPQMLPSLTDFFVVVKGTRGGVLWVQVNGMGRISTCSPDKSIGGFPSC